MLSEWGYCGKVLVGPYLQPISVSAAHGARCMPGREQKRESLGTKRAIDVDPATVGALRFYKIRRAFQGKCAAF